MYLSQRGPRAGKLPPLPPGFSTVQDILDSHVPVNKFASVIGLVKDQRLPIKTGGKDWKSSLTIYDKSTDGSDDGLIINIFRPEDKIPRPNAGDVVIIYAAKVQEWNGISLLTNRSTVIHIYSAVQIPKHPGSAQQALQPPCDPGRWMPDSRVNEYVPWLYHSTDKGAIPDQDEFRVKAEGSLHIKDRFSTLDKVQESRYYDVIVQVVKDPFEEFDVMSVWVTDYTENDGFFLFTWDGAKRSDGADYDQNMYTVTDNKSSRNWPGPFGKRSMQVSCWEQNAEFVKENVGAGTWVRLRNLHVRPGRRTQNLEGRLHSDDADGVKNKFGGRRIQVEILRTTDPDAMDPRLKDALRRKRAYEKSKKSQQKDFKSNERDSGAGTKRKADDAGPGKLNSKARRALQRTAREKKVEEQEKQKEEQLGLSKYIRCESENEPVTPIPRILEPVPWTTTIVEGGGPDEKVTINLPFVCAKYRACARVVDFRPRRLEDFARWRKKTEYDALSDLSGSDDDGEDSDDSDGSDEEEGGGGKGGGTGGNLDAYRGKKVWEWRFALRLEGVDSKGRPEPNDAGALWVVVDNVEAQQLVGLDACDLRADPNRLSTLREKLFTLWGNLEEVKSRALEQRRAVTAGRQPPPDSSPPRPGSSKANVDPATTTNTRGDLSEKKVGGEKVSNTPFACCIRQYGVKVRERDPERADAGGGGGGQLVRWQRVFGLFGTRICP